MDIGLYLHYKGGKGILSKKYRVYGNLWKRKNLDKSLFDSYSGEITAVVNV